MSRTHPGGLKLPYRLRKWPICIATWIFTVNDFDWDSNASPVGPFHSLKTQLVQPFGIHTEMCLEMPAGLSAIVLQNQVGESFYHFCRWICFKPPDGAKIVRPNSTCDDPTRLTCRLLVNHWGFSGWIPQVLKQAKLDLTSRKVLDFNGPLKFLQKQWGLQWEVCLYRGPRRPAICRHSVHLREVVWWKLVQLGGGWVRNASSNSVGWKWASWF